MTRRRAASPRTRIRVATVLVSTLVGSLLPTLPLVAGTAGAAYAKPSAVSPEKPVKGSNAQGKDRRPDTTVSAPGARQADWPAEGRAVVELPAEAGRAGRAAGLPVTLATTDDRAPQRAAVQVLGQDLARRAGISGVLLTVSGADAATRVSVDYSGFAQAAGAGFGARLRLVQLPECVLTAPERPECRVQTPLPGSNDVERQTVTAETAAPAPAAGSMRLSSGSGPTTVLAAAATTAGPSGDYKATPLSPASSWSTSLNSGSFSWAYDMPITAMPGGLTPKVGLSYNSGSIDGRTASSNNQASWAGDGFELSPGFVERTYKSCADDGVKTDDKEPGDLCWATDNATISFAGHSGELIPVGANEWRISGDDNTKITRGRDTARANGDNDGEYFRAVTTDGTRYYFGYNRLSNWSSGKPETKSVYTVPVFGNNAGEPCKGADFASSWCQQGWRWNLDLVIDSNGNDITYWYAQETNNYGRNLKAADRTPYVRGGRLDHIEYGQQQGDIYSATVKPMGRVDFGTAERCLETTAGLCDPAKIGANRQYWYDTPWDQNCDDGKDCTSQLSPTFFTRTRLTEVAAKTLQADGSYLAVDTWTLKHKWGTADFDYQLLLDSVQHTGSSATPAVPLPKTGFAYRQLANRLDKVGDGRAPFIKQRLGTITDERGGQIDVNYSAPACDWNNLPTPQTNTTRCFPQQYQPANETPVTTEWFNKYVVESVIATDRTGGAPDLVTRYSYLGDAAWHFDDEDGITKEKLKTWSQWRGYARTRVETGGTSGMSTQAEHYFLRGMHDDRSDPTDKTKKRTVTVDDGHGTVLTDDQAWAAFEYRSEQYDKPGGKIVGKTVSTPWKKETAKRVRDWGTTTANITGTAVRRSFTSLDNGAGVNWRETRTSSGYDDYGRIIRSEDLGDVAVGTDDTCTRTTYLANTSAWIFTAAAQTETVAADCTAAVNLDTRADGSSAVLSDVRQRFDDQAYGVAPTKGTATLVETLKSRTGTTATYLDGATHYDVYGRADSTTKLASTSVFDTTGATAPVTTASPLAQTTGTGYSPATGRPTKVTVTGPPVVAGSPATAMVSVTEYDLARGLPVATVDVNNRRTDLLADALGRSLKVWQPNRSKVNAQTPNVEFAYTDLDGKPNTVATRSLNADGSQDTSYVLYDGLGRARQTQAPGEAGGRVLTDTFYDERGQAALAYAPYYATGAPGATLFKVEDATGVETQTANTYDGLGRVVRSSVLAGNGVGTPLSTTLTEYGGDRVTVTPPSGGTPSTTITDAAGRTTELRHYKSATPTGDYDRIGYRYDPAGHLVNLTDQAGTQWSWAYDQQGRQVKTVDPDAGTAVKTYDDRGLLVTSKDGNNKTLAYVYDNLGRQTELHSGSPTGPLLTSQVWDPAGNKGLISSATRHVTIGSTAYQYKTTWSLYDPLGRATRTTLTVPSVPGQEALAGSYASGTVYRLDGQPQSTSYPAAGNLAGESVAFGYDALHRMNSAQGLSGYLSAQTYSPTSKPLQATLSDGTPNKQLYLTNTYEWGTQRLASSRTDLYGVATALRAAAYSYDPAGNITSITDTSRGVTDRQCFRYDYLVRLTEAFTPGTGSCPATPDARSLGGPAPYWTGYTYNSDSTRNTRTEHDRTGDTSKDVTAKYGYPGATAPQPHTLTGTSGTGVLAESFGYDPGGNTVTRHRQLAATTTSDQVLTWDGEEHLGKVVDTLTTGGTTTTRSTDYLYDPAGSRLTSHVLDSADPAAEKWTLYLGGTELTLTKGAAKPTATRYYSLGSAAAVRTDDGKVTFQIVDHHGTAELNLDAATGTVAQRRTSPFGEVRGTKPVTWAGSHGFLGGVDESTGLTHLGARDYDAANGRFVSVDPLFVSDSPKELNGYGYSGANPIGTSDPDGRKMCADDCSSRDMALHGWVGMGGTWHEPTEGPECTTKCHPPAPTTPTTVTTGSAENRKKWHEARVAWLMQPDNPIIGKYLADIRRIDKKYCTKGARDGCGAFGLAEDIMLENFVEKIAGRIDESAVPFDPKRFKTLTKKGSNLTTYAFSNGEYQIAFDLARAGSKVVAIDEGGGQDGKTPDAWVDGVLSEFKAPTSMGKGTVQENLKKMTGKGAERAYVRLPDNYEAATAMSSLKSYLHNSSADFNTYTVWGSGDAGGWAISGKVGSEPKCKGWGC
ncbi:RHS repeat-associated core domain-containing protein [Kitasatospora sp. NPDC101801]|uniref:RHS repeat-associated core domain-containing protein n=1 Tax=Kitasatospora sp. NPDC101801 TaxID=3364103 RepID=UPI0038274A23